MDRELPELPPAKPSTAGMMRYIASFLDLIDIYLYRQHGDEWEDGSEVQDDLRRLADLFESHPDLDRLLYHELESYQRFAEEDVDGD